MFFTGFADGFRERGRELRRQRSELAQAFQEFRASNPYATLTEFQSFIDQMAGPDAYLRGGAPSDQILERIAGENQERRQRDELIRRREDIMAQQNLADNLMDDAERFMLNFDGDDYDQAWTDFMEQGGFSDEDLRGTNLRAFFTPQNRDRLLGDRLMNSLPQIDNYLSMTNGNLEDTEAFARYLGIPPGNVQPFVDAAQERYARTVADWTLQNNDRVITLINREVAAGRDPEEAVTRLLQNSGINPDIYDLESATAEATRIREMEEADRARALEESNRAAIMSLENTFRTDPAIQAALRRGDREAVTNLMLNRARRYLTPEQFQNVYGVEASAATADLFTEVFESEVAEGVSGQIDAQQGRQDAVMGQAAAAQQEFIAENISTATDTLSNMYGDSAGAIAGMLAQRYVFNAQTTQAVMQAFQEVPEEMKEEGRVADIMTFVEQHPAFQAATGGAPNLREAAQRQYEATIQREGAFTVESFDDWYVRSSGELSTAYRDIETMIDRASEIADPEQRRAYLAEVDNAIMGLSTDALGRIGIRRQRADRWIEYGTGGWNDSAAIELEQGVQARAQELRARLAEEVALLNPPEDPDGTPVPGEVPETPSESGPSEFSTWRETQRGMTERRRALENLIGSYGLRGTGVGGLFNDAETQTYYGTIRDFYGDRQYRNFLIENEEAFNQFMNDPMGFIYNSEQGREFLERTGRLTRP